MRAYKTVADSYIEPISFTVPRRAEVFQSDIYPPATGKKPAMSAAEWLSGAEAKLPPKIDLESVYEGSAPVEVPGDYKPPTQAASAPTPKPTPAPVKREEPAPSPVAQRASPPTMGEQKGSISAMASRFQDKEPEADSGDESPFEEIAKPVQRAPTASKPEPVKSTPSPVSQATPTSSKASTIQTSSGPISAVGGAGAGGAGVETGLNEIKQLLQAQMKQISSLTQEVDMLKMRVGGNQDQSERIRQLELELEEARS